MKDPYDLVVLGGGSGGLAAAKRASLHGARVALVEGDRVGGTCVIRGCVPKKLLVFGSLYPNQIKRALSYGIKASGIKIDTSILLANVRSEVDRLNSLHLQFLEKAGVELINGWGRFVGPNSISVLKDDSKEGVRTVVGKNFLIAVGGRPIIPDIPGAELAWLSDDMFNQDQFPSSVVIVGAGFIACEFACILNGLGVDVTQLVRGNSLLRGFDKELTLSLQKEMERQGINIHFGQNLLKIGGMPNQLEIETREKLFIKTNGLLFATGRKPFLENLNLEACGVDISKNRILIDDKQTTNVPHIYAIGDVTNRINLTPVAIDEGRAFADHLFANKSRLVNYDLVPSAVFSNPELAMVGLTEEEATSLLGMDAITIHKASFRPMNQALHKGESRCILKLILNTENQKILGCHMLGENAAEIIQMASIAIGMGATKGDFDKTMALHPTISEEFVTMI